MDGSDNLKDMLSKLFEHDEQTAKDIAVLNTDFRSHEAEGKQRYKNIEKDIEILYKKTTKNIDELSNEKNEITQFKQMVKTTFNSYYVAIWVISLAIGLVLSVIGIVTLVNK